MVSPGLNTSKPACPSAISSLPTCVTFKFMVRVVVVLSAWVKVYDNANVSLTAYPVPPLNISVTFQFVPENTGLAPLLSCFGVISTLILNPVFVLPLLISNI